MSRPEESPGAPNGFWLQRLLAYPALVAARREMRGKQVLMKAAGVFKNKHWVGAPMRSVRLRGSDAEVELNIAEMHERWAWFLGRYHELPLQLLMHSCLRPGEVFVDVGANIGLVGLLGSTLVGPTGRVICYEPNPEVFRRLRDHITRNNRGNVLLRPVALGEQVAEMTLSVVGLNTGSATLGTLTPALALEQTASYQVPVIPGDDESADWNSPSSINAPLMLKLDAEGAEPAIVRGLSRTIDARRPLIATEVYPRGLRMNRSSPRRLRHEFLSRGYVGWTLDCRRHGKEWQPWLAPLMTLPVTELHDEVWAHPESPHWNRIQQFIG